MMKLPIPRAFLAYRHDGGRCCHNTIIHGSHHHGVARLAYDSGGSLSSSLGGSDGSVAQRLERLDSSSDYVES